MVGTVSCATGIQGHVPAQGLTSWACRRLAFHSCRMTTSHCCTVVGLRRCGGRLIKGAIPVPCRPWLPPTNVAPELEGSASSSLEYYSSLEVTCGSGSSHPSTTSLGQHPCLPVWKRPVSIAH